MAHASYTLKYLAQNFTVTDPDDASNEDDALHTSLHMEEFDLTTFEIQHPSIVPYSELVVGYLLPNATLVPIIHKTTVLIHCITQIHQ